MRCFFVGAVAVLALASLASPVAASMCKCQKNYSPYAWELKGKVVYWQCVRKPGTYKRGQHPLPMPCFPCSTAGC
jgi:hypothetical protein